MSEELITKKVKELDANYLSAIKLAETYKEGWEEAESRIKELEATLEVEENTHLDLIRRAEQAESRLKRLQDAVDRHKSYVWGDTCCPEDEELYKANTTIKDEIDTIPRDEG